MNLRLCLCCATLCALLATAGFAVEAPGSEPAVGSWGVDLSDQDRSVKPGDDFYRFENGAWLTRMETGAGHRNGNAAYWMDLRTLAPRRLNAIMEKLVADPSLAAESPEGKAAAFYRAYMNQAAVEAKGLEPFAPELNAVRAVKTRSEMAALTGAIEGRGTTRDARVVPVGRGMFSVNIDQDPQYPDRYCVQVGQGGLLLPGPEFYTDASLADFKAAYQAYASQMLGMIGWPEPERYAREIVEFETRVARVSWTHEQMLDGAKTHNWMTVAQLEKLAPNFDWRAFLEGAGVKGVDHVVVDARDAFPQLADVFAETPLDVLKARQAFAAVDSHAALLPQRISGAAVQFRSVKLAGQAGQRSRSDTAQVVLQANVPDLLGRLYARFCSSAEVKAKAQEMAGYMKQALDRRLQNVSWMEPGTRAAARAKLAQMKINIGYPDRFDDYGGLVIRDDDLYGDVTRAAAYRWSEQVADLKRPFDRGRWAMTPQYPNYNYRAETNTVEIPAALLQPPFFDPSADEAVNYGAIGGILGQVMMSGVDDRGGLRDASGRLNAWWKPADRARFETLRQGLIRQYSQFEPLPGLHVQGALIAGEAIDDQGGLLTALDAYHLALRGHPAPVIDGYSGDQRFFLGRAQMWRAKFGADFVRNQIATGANAPPFIRVNAAISNVDAWYDSFNVKPGDKLYLAPADRVHIW